jgi:hypothetical protein
MTTVGRYTITLIKMLIAVAAGFVLTCWMFDTPVAGATIDWFSFIAGGFLAIEGIYKIRKFRKDPLLLHLYRGIRVLIGADIFIIHLIQFTQGVNAEVLATPLRQALIDWSAFSFGVFLILEGAYRLLASYESSGKDQALRMIRVFIGSCVFTIHLLQFTRFGL